LVRQSYAPPLVHSGSLGEPSVQGAGGLHNGAPLGPLHGRTARMLPLVALKQIGTYPP
jgi:hypothetical protein